MFLLYYYRFSYVTVTSSLRFSVSNDKAKIQNASHTTCTQNWAPDIMLKPALLLLASTPVFFDCAGALLVYSRTGCAVVGLCLASFSNSCSPYCKSKPRLALLQLRLFAAFAVAGRTGDEPGVLSLWLANSECNWIWCLAVGSWMINRYEFLFVWHQSIYENTWMDPSKVLVEAFG